MVETRPGIKYVKPCVKVCLSQVTSKTASRIEEQQAELYERILNENWFEMAELGGL